MAPRTVSAGATAGGVSATTATSSGGGAGGIAGEAAEGIASPDSLSVDVDSLRALATTLADQSASVGAIESAARITAVGTTLAGTAVGAALAQAAAPLSEAHQRLSRSLSAMAETARSNAADFENTEIDFRDELRTVAGDGR